MPTFSWEDDAGTSQSTSQPKSEQPTKFSWDEPSPKSTKRFSWDEEDDGRSTFNKVTGWDNFDVTKVPKKVGGELLAAADLAASTPAFLLTTAERTGGLIAKQLAPLVGKSKKSIDRETDKLVEQTNLLLNEPIKKVATNLGVNKETIEEAYISKGMEKFGEGKEWVDEHLAELTGQPKRDIAVMTDVLTIPLAEGIHKLGGKAVGAVADKITAPTPESIKATRKTLDARSEAFQAYQDKVKGKTPAPTVDVAVDAWHEPTPANPVPYQPINLRESAPTTTSTATSKTGLSAETLGSYLEKASTDIHSEATGLPGKAKLGYDPKLAARWKGHEKGMARAHEKLRGMDAEALKVETQAIKDFADGKPAVMFGAHSEGLPANATPEARAKRKSEGDAMLHDLEQRVEFAKSMDAMDDTKRIDPTDPTKMLDMSKPEDVAKAKEHFFNVAADDLGKTPKELRELLDKTGAIFEHEDWSNYLQGKEGRWKEKTAPKAEETLRKYKEALESRDTEASIPTKGPEFIIDSQLLKQALKDAGLETPRIRGVDPLDPMKNPKLFKDWAEQVKDDIGYNIKSTIADKRITNNIAAEMIDMVPDAAQRSAIWEHIQRGTTDKLTGSAKELADYYSKLMDVMGNEALDAGVIKGLVNDYATRIIDMSKVDPSVRPTLLSNLQNRMSSFPTTSRFGKSRMAGNFDQFMQALKEAGLELKTTDLAEVFREYATSMNKAIENQKLINKLKEVTLPGPDKFGIFLDTKKGGIVPSNYVRLETGQFAGYAVHPEIYPALKFVMDVKEPGMVVRALLTLNSAIKRLNISTSFFHGSSLGVASLFANAPKDVRYGNVYSLVKEMREGVLKEFHEGGLGDSVDRWLRQDGLGLGVSEDVGKGSIRVIAETADRLLQKYAHVEGDWAQKATRPATWFQEKLDYATWNVLHDGLKLLTAEKYLEKAKIDHPNVSESVLRKEIAQAVNNIYGGLDWYEMARNANNKFAEKLSMNLLSPEGRRGLQMVLFAPDWTISTVRAFTESIPKNILKPMEWDLSKGLSGLQKPLTRGDYARRYQMRFALYYLTLFNGLNMALSGHPIWENEDKTSIDLGDGRTMAMMKHPMEPFHWMSDFDKTLANKLGFVPKSAIKTLGGVEYASPLAPKMEDPSAAYRAKSLLKDALPFSMGSLDKGWQETLGGFVGLPIRGMTPEQKAESQANRKKRKAEREAKQTLDKREDE